MDFLPSLAPQDSYALWYQPLNSNNPPTRPDPNHHDHPSHSQNTGGQHHSSRRHQPDHRTPLARLRLDEEYIERRKSNIQNFGSSWIKPVGISKSLHQLREEEREMKEHQEALRREALAQELAEAEAEGAEALQDEGEMEEARDLDDDVPDADAETTGLDAEDSDDSDSDSDEEEEEEENETQEVPRGVLQAQVPQDIFREALARGQDVRVSQFGGDGASTIEDEEHSGMLHEEDLVHDVSRGSLGLGIDMDADLDAGIPEAEEEGMYEHTDTEEELSSEDEESVDQGHLPQQPSSTSQVRSDGTQNSMDFSSLISASSQAGASSSPRLRRQL